MRRIWAWFAVSAAAIAVYTVLASLDVSLLFLWPLLLVAWIGIVKLWTVRY
jgi:hypothetical protein